MKTTTNIKEAIKIAKKIRGYACIVKTGGKGVEMYTIELEPPFIRNNEELIAQFENGKKI